MVAEPICRFEAALAAWGRSAVLSERLGGGYRNDVRRVRLAGVDHVGRLSRRDAAALDWELGLLDHLSAVGLRVPRIVHALDGRRHVDGLVVMRWLDGAPPASEADWRRVAAVLRHLHAVTLDWTRRPGFASTRQLLASDRGGDVRLDLMPTAAVARCRAAWRAIAAEPQSVVHGDPGAANLRLSRDGVGLIDWDEARVDASVLDLADLPLDDLPDREGDRRRAAIRAASAWEAANGWVIEPEYARRRLASV
jgi:Ser/Thr protein kinase RdoA (MazF antagonist)